MKLTGLLRERKLSVYQCAKESTVPYTTLLDIVKGKTRIEQCTAETLYKLVKTLNVAMGKSNKNLLGKKMVSGKFLSSGNGGLFEQGK